MYVLTSVIDVLSKVVITVTDMCRLACEVVLIHIECRPLIIISTPFNILYVYIYHVIGTCTSLFVACSCLVVIVFHMASIYISCETVTCCLVLLFVARPSVGKHMLFNTFTCP